MISLLKVFANEISDKLSFFNFFCVRVWGGLIIFDWFEYELNKFSFLINNSFELLAELLVI